MEMIELSAPAKVNIALDIVSKRADGYHEMRMINHSLQLADRLTIKKSDAITLSSNDGRVPLNEKNIVYKTIMQLRKYTGKNFGADVFIDKQIPLEAGLAGGSADAAAVLKGLNIMLELGLTMEKLTAVGVRCGADVPYCLTGGSALVEGIGERISPIRPFPDYAVLVIKPSVNIATPQAFALADDCDNPFHPNIEGAVRCIEQGDFDGAKDYYGNSFETVIFPIYPEIEKIKKDLAERGAFYVTMTGSGSTVIAYYKNRDAAKKAEAAYAEKMFTCLTAIA